MDKVYDSSTFYNDLVVFKKMTSNKIVDNDDIPYKDNKWLINSFMVKSTELNTPDNINRFWSSVENKFTDSSMGGNIALNPLPQYTRYCDVRVKGRRSDRNDVSVNHLDGNYGMGRRYGEVIDDNSVHVFLTFGVPKFNNLLSFLTGSIDYRQSLIANTGRSPIAYDAGNMWGTLALFVAFPIIGPLLWIGTKLINFLLGPGSGSYYYMEPNMLQYWSSVNTMVTMAATELGILMPSFSNKNTNKQSIGSPLKINQDDLDFMRQYMPDLLTEDNYIDVMAIATKAQRMANNQFKNDMMMFDNMSDSALKDDAKNFVGLVQNNMSEVHNIPQTSFISWVNEIMMTNAKDIYAKDKNKKTPINDTNASTTTDVVYKENKNTANDDGTLNTGKREVDSPSFLDSLKDNFDATVRQGTQYLVLRVDNPGQISESFRNDVGDIGLEGAMKGISGKVRDIKFSTGNGSILPGTKGLIDGISDILHGSLGGLTMGLSDVLTVLEGGGNIGMMKRWEDSTVTFPTMTLKTKFISPYNNPISLLTNIYIPFFALLAGALPKATGTNSYTSPYLCSMFMRGHQYIKTGMITSLTVTRGTSNLSFNKQMRPLAIDVSFTITDFSKIMAAPTPQGIFDPSNIAFNDENSMNKYIASLCGRDLHTTMNSWPKMRLKLSRLDANIEHTFSSANIGIRLGGLMPNWATSILSAKSLNYSDNY